MPVRVASMTGRVLVPAAWHWRMRVQAARCNLNRAVRACPPAHQPRRAPYTHAPDQPRRILPSRQPQKSGVLQVKVPLTERQRRRPRPALLSGLATGMQGAIRPTRMVNMTLILEEHDGEEEIYKLGQAEGP